MSIVQVYVNRGWNNSFSVWHSIGLSLICYSVQFLLIDANLPTLTNRQKYCNVSEQVQVWNVISDTWMWEGHYHYTYRFDYVDKQWKQNDRTFQNMYENKQISQGTNKQQSHYWNQYSFGAQNMVRFYWIVPSYFCGYNKAEGRSNSNWNISTNP